MIVPGKSYQLLLSVPIVCILLMIHNQALGSFPHPIISKELSPIHTPQVLQPTKITQQQFFHERTKIFDLNITLLNKNRLIITMKDFIDWIIFSKEYTEADIGKQISRKMDVIDVYAAFAGTRARCDQERMGEGLYQGKYQFGDVVKIVNGGFPGYKIESGGRITAYLSMIDTRTNKQVTYESKLTLNKIRNMFETEISTETNVQKFEQLSKQIQKEKMEKEQLVKRVIKLEEQNQKQKREVMEIREELRIIKQGLTLKDLQLKEMYKNMMALPQVYRNQFKVEGLKVEYVGDNNFTTQFIFNKPISPTQTINFKIKINKTQARHIGIGVTDYAKQKEQRRSFDSGNAMFYAGHTTRKWPENVQEGDGFKQGDIVEVEVNRINSSIRYSINGVLQATQLNQILGDNSRFFFPCVEMFHTNDQVEWLL